MDQVRKGSLHGKWLDAQGNMFHLALATVRELCAASPATPQLQRLHGLVAALAVHHGFQDRWPEDMSEDIDAAFADALADPKLRREAVLHARTLMAIGDAERD